MGPYKNILLLDTNTGIQFFFKEIYITETRIATIWEDKIDIIWVIYT